MHDPGYHRQVRIRGRPNGGRRRERIPMKRDAKDRSVAFRGETSAALLLLATYAAAIAAVIVAIAFICRPLAG